MSVRRWAGMGEYTRMIVGTGVVWSCSPTMPTSLVDLLVTCDRVLVGEELGGERRWRKLNIELNDLTDCDDE